MADNTLRVPEGSITEIPALASRKSKLLSFDDKGNPDVIPPDAGEIGYQAGTVHPDKTVGSKLDDIVVVEDFKDRVTTDGDWGPAVQAALTYARQHGRQRVYGDCTLYLKHPIIIDGWTEGLDLRLTKVIAHEQFPVYSHWASSSALIVIGTPKGGNMVGLEIHVGYMDGKNRCSGVQIVGGGCGGSRIHIGRARHLNIVYDCHKQTWQSASNTVTGDYWSEGNMGIYLARGTEGKYPIVEGHKISVGFICNMIYGGILCRNGAQYTQLSGDADFNGCHLSEVTFDGTSFEGLSRGTLITNGTTTGEVLAFYQQTADAYRVLIIEDKDVSGGKSSFAPQDKLTSGDWHSTVSAVRTAKQGENFFFDIILDFADCPFAKMSINCGYLGGLVGASMHSCSISYHNSYSSNTNAINGAQWLHSGAVMTLRDAFANTNVMDITAHAIALSRHLLLRGNRVYGAEYATQFSHGASKTIHRFQYTGPENAPGIKDMWIVHISGPTQFSGIASSFKVAVSPDGLEIFDSTINPVSKITLSSDGLALNVMQTSQKTLLLYFTFTKL
ncbi:hypothetical protein [Serratia rhizosphaerae]|uniref:hypothetical protein n=1 Tax=Serratia rhizosphaerae TaxID=2597702 RepID=UPI002DB7B41E|nr:hypothetical protein [Serratia rhizosphaerae]MEB6338117.1 hypothetical protein [Serratia rhizosphaerae]